MAESQLLKIIEQLESLKANNLKQAPQLLSQAKRALLSLNALVPGEHTKPEHHALATHVLELGALLSIRLKDTDSFTRYYQQLQPFYSLPAKRWSAKEDSGDPGKVTGLYLLLLLSLGDYAGFHTVLEGLELSSGKEQIEKDRYIQYPVRLEQALMEGSYDKVWGETKGERVPSEEFGVFSEVRRFRSGLTARLRARTDKVPRCSSTPSALKLRLAPNERTLLCPSPMPRTSFSSTPKVR